MSLADLFNESAAAQEPEVKKPKVQVPKAPEPVTKTESVPSASGERPAARLNTILRRFIVNGYSMDISAGKYRVMRGSKQVTGWCGSFLDAITAATHDIMGGNEFPDIGESPYTRIGRLLTLLQEAQDLLSIEQKGDVDKTMAEISRELNKQ